jgi:MOSC domain-containing protein YiiM
MNSEMIINGLNQLGFPTGWVVVGDEITLWENEAPQPTSEEIEQAANLFEQTQIDAQAEARAAKAALLQRLGITEDEAKLLLA